MHSALLPTVWNALRVTYEMPHYKSKTKVRNVSNQKKEEEEVVLGHLRW